MPTAIDTTAMTGPLSRDGYRRLIEQIQEAARRHIEPGSTVAVVSRGDEDLLRLDGLRTCHFPDDADGQYAGYHPASGADAVARLQAARAAGADHLLIPRTAFWWLDHYEELATHLDAEWQLLTGDTGACRIYGPPGVESRRPRGGAVGPSHASRQQLAFLDSLFPPGVSVGVVGGEQAAAIVRHRVGAIALPVERLDPWPGTGDRALAEAATLADYLFVPAAVPADLPTRRRLLAALSGAFRLLASREHLGTLFDLRTLQPREPS